MKETGVIGDIRPPEGLDQIYTDLKAGDEIIKVDPAYFRPTEVDFLIGDATKARTKLKWEPEHSLHDLIQDMVCSDLAICMKQKILLKNGYIIIILAEYESTSD